MNLKQAEIVLEKITRLYKSMKLDERNIDAFEQDLMLSYIRQLYESFAPDQPVAKRIKPVLPPKEDTPIISTPSPISKPKPAPAPKPEPPKVKEVPEVKKVPEVVKTPETPKVVEKPKVPEAPKVPEVPKVVEKPKPVEKPKVVPPRPAPIKPSSSSGLSASDKADLFDFKQATELSEKLSMAPIKDLTKAMGLNEKIFTINELFGGDSKVFDETIKQLNTFTAFTQARDYLADGVAHKFEWTNRSRKKKAMNFIQLVKRRYN